MRAITYPLIVLLIAALVVLATNSEASEYITNMERVPAIERQPPRIASWKYTPTVVVCDFAPVVESEVNRAVQYWKNKGFRFYKTNFKQDHLKKCTDPSPEGRIIIRLATKEVLENMKESSLAETHFYVDNDLNKIDWAIIYLPRRGPQIRVLEHELGHALGFLHYNKKGHLMHEKWIQGGWDDDGLHR